MKPSSTLLALLLLLPVGASAAEVPTPSPPLLADNGWLLGGAALGHGNALQGELGWPGLQLTFLHSYSDKIDVGGRFGFSWGFEGLARVRAVPGLHFDGAVRLEIVRDPRFSVGLRFDPGLELYFFSSALINLGLSLPLEVVAGTQLTRELLLTFGVSLPMTLLFSTPFAFLFPVQPGLGLEYRVDRSLSLTFDTRLGPTFATSGAGLNGALSFRALFGVGYRL